MGGRRATVSTGSLAGAVGRRYWELEAALDVAVAVGAPIELVLQPEWDPAGPPVTPFDGKWSRDSWREPEEVVRLAACTGLPVISVHASRDTGKLLAGTEDEAARGRRQLREAFGVASALGAQTVVLHAWDTYDKGLLPDAVAGRIAAAIPKGVGGTMLSIEGIPVSTPGLSPALMANAVAAALNRNPGGALRAGTTVDLNWTSLAGDLGVWLPYGAGVASIHVRGALRRTGDVCQVRPTDGFLDFAETLTRLRDVCPPGTPATLEIVRPGSVTEVADALRWTEERWVSDES